MPKPPGKPTGKQPPAPMQMEDSVAHVAVMRPVKRRRTTSSIPPKDVEKPREATGAGTVTKPDPPPPPPEPKLPDISRREADQLVQTQIVPFVAALKTDYSAEHIVFPERAALDEALVKARRIVSERRELLVERLTGYAGPNVESVEEAWDEALADLGEITLQEDHWAAEPESVIGEWRRKFATGPDGERLSIVFYRVSSLALRPREAAAKIEEEILPDAVEAVLGLVDWDEDEKITRGISEAEGSRIEAHRQRLSEALAGVSGSQRAHYLVAYHGALGAVATGSPENRFRSSSDDERLVALFIDLVAS